MVNGSNTHKPAGFSLVSFRKDQLEQVYVAQINDQSTRLDAALCGNDQRKVQVNVPQEYQITRFPFKKTPKRPALVKSPIMSRREKHKAYCPWGCDSCKDTLYL